MTTLDLDALEAAIALIEYDGPDLDLHGYDLVIVNSSAGKDSLVIKAAVRRAALAQGYPLDKVVVQYNALGDRVTWPGTADIGPNTDALLRAFGHRPGTRQLVEQQCATLGFRLVVTSRSHATDADLLDHIARHGRFPNSGNRFWWVICTSDHKRGPGKKLITAEYQKLGLDRPARVLYVFGFRAAESSGRAKKADKLTDPQKLLVAGADANGCRVVDEWYPVFRWSDTQVWDRIRADQLPYHWAYDAGMNRLSCSLCVLAGEEDLVLAAALRPDVAVQYLAVERANLARGRACGDMKGRTFQDRRSMVDIITAARTHPAVKRLGLHTDLLDQALAA